MDFINFDDVISLFNNLKGGELVLIGSCPSLEKAKLALSLIKEISINKKIGSCFFSIEMSKEALGKRALDMNFDINNKNLHIFDNPDLDIIKLREILEKNKDENVKYCFIDYLGLIVPVADDKRQNNTEIAKKLKTIALELNVTIIALMQFNKEFNGIKLELSHFDSLENIADVILTLNKNTEKDKTEIIFLKNVK